MAFRPLWLFLLLAPVAASADDKFEYLRVDGDRLVSERKSADEIARACPHCVKTTAPGQAPRYFDGIRAYDRALVDDCVSRVPVGTRVRVQDTALHLCRESHFLQPDVNYGNNVTYDLWRALDGPHIGMSLRFMTSDELEPLRAYKMFVDLLYKCDQLQKTLRRYGVRLETQLLLTKVPLNTPGDASFPETRIDLSDTFGRSNSGHIYFRGQANWFDCFTCIGGKTPCPAGCQDDVSADVCKSFAHETAHLLGLPDEYKDPDCPDRVTEYDEADPWSLMGQGLFNDPEKVELFPRHIAPILWPLCRGTDAAFAQRLPLYLWYEQK